MLQIHGRLIAALFTERSNVSHTFSNMQTVINSSYGALALLVVVILALQMLAVTAYYCFVI
jgi:hypothetical protein